MTPPPSCFLRLWDPAQYLYSCNLPLPVIEFDLEMHLTVKVIDGVPPRTSHLFTDKSIHGLDDSVQTWVWHEMMLFARCNDSSCKDVENKKLCCHVSCAGGRGPRRALNSGTERGGDVAEKYVKKQPFDERG